MIHRVVTHNIDPLVLRLTMWLERIGRQISRIARLRGYRSASPGDVVAGFSIANTMRKDLGHGRLRMIVAGEQQQMRRLRETSLDSRRKSRTLRTVEPSLHRIVGFETKNRHPFRLHARDRTKYFGADKSGKLPRRIRDKIG